LPRQRGSIARDALRSAIDKRRGSGILDPPGPPHAREVHPMKPDYQLAWIVQHGVRYSGMFVMEGAFRRDSLGHVPSNEKIWTAVTFLTHLDSLPPSVAAKWQK
jgi:hypothetical protein